MALIGGQASKRIRLRSTSVEYFISSNWRAGKRLELKQAVEKALLSRSKFNFCSVSHTRHLGGFALSSRSVGFDLEPAGRSISQYATARFATAEELLDFQNNALAVWVSKEAAFKALRGASQPKTVSAIRLKLRSTRTPNECTVFLFNFYINGYTGLTFAGIGRCEVSNRTIMGFALINP